MAEAFAKAYGADIITPASAGIAPATMISPLTRSTLKERSIDIEDHFPKPLDIMPRDGYDLVVNMSGGPIFWTTSPIINWNVPDPIGLKDTVYRQVADQLERLVMRLILELRNSS